MEITKITAVSALHAETLNFILALHSPPAVLIIALLMPITAGLSSTSGQTLAVKRQAPTFIAEQACTQKFFFLKERKKYYY